MFISTSLIFRIYQTMPVNLILKIMLGKLLSCNKGTRIPEVTSVTVYNYNSPRTLTLNEHVYMHLVQTNVKVTVRWQLFYNFKSTANRTFSLSGQFQKSNLNQKIQLKSQKCNFWIFFWKSLFFQPCLSSLKPVIHLSSLKPVIHFSSHKPVISQACHTLVITLACHH